MCILIHLIAGLLEGSCNFNQYSKNGFSDKEQMELKVFCDRLTTKGCKVMQSNSYSTNKDGTSYFENLYEGYQTHKVLHHDTSMLMLKNVRNSLRC